MSERVKKTFEYVGFDKPSTPLEVDFEIAGLNIIISKAQMLVYTLEQSKLLANIEIEKIKNA